MNKIQTKHPYILCLFVFLLCSIARLIEYYLIRTDETVIAENVFHKMFGIIVLLVSLRMTNMSLSDIGFKADYFKHIGKGLLLGFICFALSYSLEMRILFLQGKHPTLDFYASGFSLQGDAIQQRTIRAVLLCLVFNIVNVVMEEGIFRGFNLRVTEGVSSFAKANLFTAFLFGIWHWVMPLRSFTDGESSLTNLLVMGIGYVILAGIMSIKWGLLYKMSGCLWIGLGDHLFNNVIATNLVHVVTENEADSMQIVRILAAQLLSFLVVIGVYRIRRKGEKQ